MNDLTGDQLRSTVEQLKKVSDQIDAVEAQKKELNKEYERLSNIILIYLQKTGQTSVKFPGLFHCIEVTDYYFSQPSSQEEEEQFNEWLKENDMESLRKVNSQTLNAEMNKMRKAAEESEEVFLPPPGIGLPTVRHKIRAKKA